MQRDHDLSAQPIMIHFLSAGRVTCKVCLLLPLSRCLSEYMCLSEREVVTRQSKSKTYQSLHYKNNLAFIYMFCFALNLVYIEAVKIKLYKKKSSNNSLKWKLMVAYFDMCYCGNFLIVIQRNRSSFDLFTQNCSTIHLHN